jgi:hypothetical protein
MAVCRHAITGTSGGRILGQFARPAASAAITRGITRAAPQASIALTVGGPGQERSERLSLPGAIVPALALPTADGTASTPHARALGYGVASALADQVPGRGVRVASRLVHHLAPAASEQALTILQSYGGSSVDTLRAIRIGDAPTLMAARGSSCTSRSSAARPIAARSTNRRSRVGSLACAVTARSGHAGS